MTETPVDSAVLKRWVDRRLLGACVLITATWAVWFVMQAQLSRLDFSRFGNDIDIPEMMAMDKIRARTAFPWAVVQVVIDYASLLLLGHSYSRVQLLPWIVVFVGWLLTTLCVGFTFCFFSFFRFA